MAAEYDVVVVGAGLAGLRAAQLLQAAGKRVLVLEARERVGGRTLTLPFAGRFIDLGAQWVGPQQKRIVALADSLNIERAEQSTQGLAQWHIGTHSGTSSGLSPKIPFLQVLRLLNVTARMDWLARRVPNHAPWEAARAAAWDAASVEDFLQRHAGDGLAHAILTASMRVLFATEPRDISLLHALFYIHAGGGLKEITSVKHGAQEWWFPKGAGSIAPRLAQDLNVRLSEPVRAIDQSGEHVEVRSERGRYTCTRAIVALPPLLTRDMQFTPTLPAARIGLARGTPMGAVIKCFLQYERPFWRDAGLSGEGFSDGPAGLIMDSTPKDSREGTLVVFILGDRARQLSGRPEERKRAVLSALALQLGTRAAAPLAYQDHDWCSEQYSRGCYSGIFGLGTLSAYGRALRDPVGRIHWAGTETATDHEGYMEGALESAERVVREVL